jgi:hypothetical protein
MVQGTEVGKMFFGGRRCIMIENEGRSSLWLLDIKCFDGDEELWNIYFGPFSNRELADSFSECVLLCHDCKVDIVVSDECESDVLRDKEDIKNLYFKKGTENYITVIYEGYSESSLGVIEILDTACSMYVEI